MIIKGLYFHISFLKFILFMQNKTAIIALTILVMVLCLYYLSFTFVSFGVQNDAENFAKDEKGNVDYFKKQRYLDSLRNKPVYNLGFTEFTLKEVKDNELHLGLDLQGGMHVVLEVSPVEILRAMSGNSNDPNFNKAIADASARQKNSQVNYTDLFFEEYEKIAGKNQLNKVFAISANRGRIDFKTPEPEIKRIINNEVDGAIDRSYNIIRTRIDKFGVTQPNIQRIPGTSRIQIELPGVDNPERVRKLLQGVAKLEFWEVWSANEYFKYLQQINDFWVKREKTGGKKEELSDLAAKGDTTKKQTTDSLLAKNDKDTSKTDTSKKSLEESLSKNGTDTTNKATSPLFSKLVQLNQNRLDLTYDAADTSAINSLLNEKEVRSMLPMDMQFLWSVKPVAEAKETGKSYFELYAIKKKRKGEAPLTGEVITDAGQGFDERGRPDVSMQMNSTGAKEWKRLTAKNLGRQIAIVLDNYVYSAPVVQSEISGGNSSISGSFDVEEAKDLANILKAGKLPAPTTIVEEAVVGPSLGKEAIQQGLNSVLAGFLIVVAFMVFYYAKSGLIANTVLLINVFFIIGILAQLNASLTLPGIAGIVLTIGMAVDANVLIFERIREELRNGLALFPAVKEGYSRAFWSIFDSNITTLLTAFFLYSLGTGPIKGFAITLIIGIICSFFTAVYVSKVIVFYILEKNEKANISFGTPFSMKLFDNINFDFIGKRKMAYTFSAVLIVIGLGIMAVKGLNLGVDFKGGRTYIVEFNKNVVASDIKVALQDDFENTGLETKSYDSPNKIKVTTVYLIDDETDIADNKVLAALNKGLQEFSSLEPKILSSSKVGATIADDIKSSSFLAISASLIAIFLYIFLRFRKWHFGVGAIVALFHDVLVVLSLFAIAGAVGLSFEVDQVFIAAVLTVIGYSINDTVVVFDRVREFLTSKKSDETLELTLNNSINSTLSRTVITSLTTVVVVLVLFVAGGEVLRGFSFALLVGLFFGTYSSIFIATPIVLDTLKASHENMEQESEVEKTAERIGAEIAVAKAKSTKK